MKVFEYIASQRGQEGDHNYNGWGGWFFTELIKCVHYTKDLTWKEGTKNISFKPASISGIGTFIESIKEHQQVQVYYYKLLNNYY